MHTINIFLASPFEVSEWRIVIGDLIRRWSDISEPHGYRLRLLCWEDFMPEFTGARKQTEYNEQLIKNCNIFVALFKIYCGKYTKEEIDFAKSMGLKHIYFLVVNSSEDRHQLDNYLKTETFPTMSFDTQNELVYHLGNIIKEYIDTLSKPKPKSCTGDVRKLYSTFSDDWQELAPVIGNTIRSLDYIVDSQMGMRVRMYENGIEKLESCHYYMGFINSILSKAGREEIHYAIDNTSDSNCLSRSILYFKKKDDFLNKDTDINNLLRGNEIFSEEFENVYKIKWNLLIWFLHEALSDVDTRCGLKFDDDWITFMGIPIIPTKNLNIRFDSSWDENRKLIFLLAEINKRQLSQGCEKLGDGSAPLDFEIISSEINSIEHNQVLANKLENDTIYSIKQLLGKVDSRMDALEMSRDNAEELFDLNKIRERLLSYLLKYDPDVASDLLSTKFFFTTIYDNFEDLILLKDYNQDLQYLDIVSFADKHNLRSPAIEMQRMNYANYLIRHNQPDDAIRNYETARRNLNKFNIQTPLFAQYSFALYVNYIQTLLGLGVADPTAEIIAELEHKLNDWNDSHLIVNLYEVYKVCLYAAKLRFGVDVDLDYGITLLNDIFKKGFVRKVPIELYDDVYYYFPNTLAAKLIDAQTYENTVTAINILLNSHQRMKNETNLDTDSKLFHTGEMTHNLALAYNRIGNSATAFKYIFEALENREKLYQHKKREDNLFHLAESYYILSIIHLYQKTPSPLDVKKGIKMADRAIDIYTQLNKGYIEQVTCIYKAKLAKASLQLLLPETFSDGKKLMSECCNWALIHPDSNYRETIIEEYKLRFPK